MDSIFDVRELVRRLGCVKNKDRLEKIVFIINQKFPGSFGYRFNLGVGGVYSVELSNDVDYMIKIGLFTNLYKLEVVEREEFDGDDSIVWLDFAKILDTKYWMFLDALSALVYLSCCYGYKHYNVDITFKQKYPEYSDILGEIKEFACEYGLIK